MKSKALICYQINVEHSCTGHFVLECLMGGWRWWSDSAVQLCILEV